MPSCASLHRLLPGLGLETPPTRLFMCDGAWKVEGNVKKSLVLSLSELTEKFKPVSVAAVNQCSGNSRSRLLCPI
jgi:hypothetical protein